MTTLIPEIHRCNLCNHKCYNIKDWKIHIKTTIHKHNIQKLQLHKKLTTRFNNTLTLFIEISIKIPNEKPHKTTEIAKILQWPYSTTSQRLNRLYNANYSITKSKVYSSIGRPLTQWTIHQTQRKDEV